MPGTDLVPFENYAIAQVEIGEIVETIKANIEGQPIDEFALERIRMPGAGSTTWEIPTLEGTVESKTLTGVIVYTKLVRAYWQTSYDDGGGSDMPDCSSRNSDQAFPSGDFMPPAPQHALGGFACAGCELAKFGSAKQGGGQACQQKRLVFMLTQGDVLPIVVALAPTSLKAAGDYMLRLTRAARPYWQVQTTIALEKHTDPKPHARALFTKAADLSEAEFSAIRSYRDALVPHFEQITPTDVGAGTD
jgi:hypothetical protein